MLDDAMSLTESELKGLAIKIKDWGQELGFQQVGIADTELIHAENILKDWLTQGMHGDMQYMEHHGTKRTRPTELIPGTLRIISVRMDYFPPRSRDIADTLEDSTLAFVFSLRKPDETITS